MAGGIRIRETVKNGRVHWYKTSYDDVRSALIAMKGKIQRRLLDYNEWYCVEGSDIGFVRNYAEVTTDKDTKFVITCGKSHRTFELAIKRTGEVIPFGHLLKR